MTGHLYSPRRSLFLPLGLLALYFAAGCGESASNGKSDYPTWTARPEFRFSSDHDRDVSLSQVPYLRVDPVRNRVFVIDLLGQPITAWTPEGSVVFSARRNGAPGVVDLFELDADGDTLWRQSLSLPPLQLTAERVEQVILRG